GDQKLRVGGVWARRVQRHVTLGRIDTVVVLPGLIVAVGLHQERLARPIRIWIFAVDLIELFRRFLVILLVVEQEQALVIEPVGRRIGNVVFVLVEQAAAHHRR